MYNLCTSVQAGKCLGRVESWELAVCSIGHTSNFDIIKQNILKVQNPPIYNYMLPLFCISIYLIHIGAQMSMTV